MLLEKRGGGGGGGGGGGNTYSDIITIAYTSSRDPIKRTAVYMSLYCYSESSDVATNSPILYCTVDIYDFCNTPTSKPHDYVHLCTGLTLFRVLLWA